MEPVFRGLPPEPPKPLVDPMELTTGGEPTPPPPMVDPMEYGSVTNSPTGEFTLNPQNFAQLGTRVNSIEDRLGKLGTVLDNQFSPRSQMGIGSFGGFNSFGGFGSPYGQSPYGSMTGFSSPFASPLYAGIGQYFPYF